MDGDLGSLLQQLPPGGDIFEGVQQLLVDQVYPDLGRAFWIQSWVALAVLCIAGVLFLVTLVVKARRGKLNFIFHDGSCSRIELKTAIPFLWILTIALQISFALSFRRCLIDRNYTKFMGTMWIVVYAVPSITYALLSASVLASAPPVRRFLGRLPYGVIWYNLTVILLSCAVIVGIIVPALHHARTLQGISSAYDQIAEAIQAAQARQDLNALLEVMGMLPLLDKADLEYRSATRVVTGVSAAFLAFYMFTGGVPALILGRLVYQKITRLQAGNNSSDDSYELSGLAIERLDLTQTLNIELGQNASVEKIADFPEQPKDRPFAQLIAIPTTPFPARFQAVLQAEEQTAQQKADRLRAIVRTDLKVFTLFSIALATFLAGCLFLACGGLNHLSAKGDLIFGFTYFTWNFAIIASSLAVLLCWDAFYDSRADGLYRTAEKPQQRSTASGLSAIDSRSGIQCSQIIAVSYARDCEPETTSYDRKNIRVRKEDIF